jgi:ADP-dependent NAD(P)H-hydrate dehydratase / NAD(P)H-hydrate epimerase
LREQTVVCGCGGGDAVRHVLPQVLSLAPRLVLDADALNAIAVDTSLQTLLIARSKRGKLVGLSTILTPHPLEAARLLGMSAAQVQADRLAAAQTLADRFGCVVVLKGAGSIIAAPALTPQINASGNAKLATAGTGDVLAGVVGAFLAATANPFQAACSATFLHGLAADQSPQGQALTASELVKLLSLDKLTAL